MNSQLPRCTCKAMSPSDRLNYPQIIPIQHGGSIFAKMQICLSILPLFVALVRITIKQDQSLWA
uniref:Uncharacterized protein n=1 Tax=Tolypothrix bouteillei VB521301 TaxID=1479485 RepID=A0A0C1RH57_9CYAN